MGGYLLGEFQVLRKVLFFFGLNSTQRNQGNPCHENLELEIRFTNTIMLPKFWRHWIADGNTAAFFLSRGIFPNSMHHLKHVAI